MWTKLAAVAKEAADARQLARSSAAGRSRVGPVSAVQLRDQLIRRDPEAVAQAAAGAGEPGRRPALPSSFSPASSASGAPATAVTTHTLGTAIRASSTARKS